MTPELQHQFVAACYNRCHSFKKYVPFIKEIMTCKTYIADVFKGTLSMTGRHKVWPQPAPAAPPKKRTRSSSSPPPPPAPTTTASPLKLVLPRPLFSASRQEEPAQTYEQWLLDGLDVSIYEQLVVSQAQRLLTSTEKTLDEHEQRLLTEYTGILSKRPQETTPPVTQYLQEDEEDEYGWELSFDQ